MKHEATLKTLGRRITLLREAQNLTRDDVAELIGISNVSYGKIERGETDVSISRLEDIAKALKIPVSEIMKMSEGGVYIVSGYGAFGHFVGNHISEFVNINEASKKKKDEPIENEWIQKTFIAIQETLKSIEKRLDKIERKVF